MNTKSALTANGLREWIIENKRLPQNAQQYHIDMILRALSLLAAIEDASGPTPETDALYGNPDRTEADEHYHAVRLERERNAALRALDSMKEGK